MWAQDNIESYITLNNGTNNLLGIFSPSDTESSIMYQQVLANKHKLTDSRFSMLACPLVFLLVNILLGGDGE